MKQKNRYISGIIYMVSFMLPCICWPEAFMLMWVDDEHGHDGQDGEDRQGQVLCSQAVLGHTGQVDAEEIHVLAELGDGADLIRGEAAGRRCSRPQ